MMETLLLALAAFAIGAATTQTASVLWVDYVLTHGVARFATGCALALVCAGALATLVMLFILRPNMTVFHLLATGAGVFVTFHAFRSHVRKMLGLPPFANRLPPWWY